MSKSFASSSWLGWGFGATYLLAAFTLVITACLPLALLAMAHVTGSGAERAQALLVGVIAAAALVAVGCVVAYYGGLRHRAQWQRPGLLLMWALSALGMLGWWKL